MTDLDRLALADTKTGRACAPTRRVALGRVLACVFLPTVAHAQAYPSRPIRIIVPFPPGGGMDAVVRPLALELADLLGQPIIVENKAGAGSVIGVDAAAKAPPDGYTLVCVATSFTANVALVPKLPYDTEKDFRPISLLVRAPHVLVGRRDLPPRDLRELVAYAKASPGKLSYGSPGNGTGQHLAGEGLKVASGIDMVHVPYKGDAQALTDVLGGQVDLAIVNLGTAEPQIRAGKIRAFGVGSSSRALSAPDIPTIAEQGYPGFEAVAWFALITQARVPDAIVLRLSREVAKALSSSTLHRRLVDAGYEPAPTSPTELDAMIRASVQRAASIIHAANIKLD